MTLWDLFGVIKKISMRPRPCIYSNTNQGSQWFLEPSRAASVGTWKTGLGGQHEMVVRTAALQGYYSTTPGVVSYTPDQTWLTGSLPHAIPTFDMHRRHKIQQEPSKVTLLPVYMRTNVQTIRLLTSCLIPPKLLFTWLLISLGYRAMHVNAIHQLTTRLLIKCNLWWAMGASPKIIKQRKKQEASKTKQLN
jgi:hypothetical protein